MAGETQSKPRRRHSPVRQSDRSTLSADGCIRDREPIDVAKRTVKELEEFGGTSGRESRNASWTARAPCVRAGLRTVCGLPARLRCTMAGQLSELPGPSDANRDAVLDRIKRVSEVCSLCHKSAAMLGLPRLSKCASCGLTYCGSERTEHQPCGCSSDARRPKGRLAASQVPQIPA